MKRLALALLAPFQVASANPATVTEHVVEEGETLGGIANRAGVPVAVIAAANGLSEPYEVQKGQKLIIPRQRSHTVRPGETGFSIALQYGVPFEQIAIANGLAPPYTVKAGQRLIIPAILKAAPPAPKPREAPYFRWPHDGKVILWFAKRSDGGGHDGIDLAVRSGDMVRASATGTVIRVDEQHPRFGRLVVIDHGGGWLTAYGHLARVTVRKGDVVKGGERIAIAVAPELHFEILKDDREVNPADRLPKRKPS